MNVYFDGGGAGGSQPTEKMSLCACCDAKVAEDGSFGRMALVVGRPTFTDAILTRNNSGPAQPNLARLRVFRRLICPSASF